MKKEKTIQELLKNFDKDNFFSFISEKSKLGKGKVNVETVMYQLKNLFSYLVYNFEKIDKSKIFSIKEGKLEYGYYPSANITTIITLIELFKLNKFYDLGSGLGLLSNTINWYFESVEYIQKGLKVVGFENEISFVEYTQKVYPRITWIHKDILTLSEKDFSPRIRSMIYYYEPFRDEVQNSVFFNKLITSISKSHLIVCRSGFTDVYIRKNKEVFERDFIFKNIDGLTLICKK